MRLKRVIRDNEWILCKECLKRFELFSLAMTWPSTVWSRSRLMVPLPQSALRPQNAALHSALNDNDLCGFRTKQMESQEKTLSNGLFGTKNKKKNYPQLRRYTCRSINAFAPSFTRWYLHVSGSVGLAGCLIWTTAVSTDVLWWEKRRKEHRWVSVVGTRWLSGKVSVSFSCPYVLIARAWRQNHHTQAEAFLAQREVPHIPSDIQEVSGKRGHQEKTGPNAKHFADYTRMEIHRSTIITSILSPNLILCKVILGLSIA